MKQFLKANWPAIVIGLIVCAVAAFALLQKPTPPLSKKQEQAVKATITKNQEQVNIDTSRARHAEENATALYKTGQAYATIATLHHQQSKPHANPVSVSDSAAERLQRFLSNY